MVHECRDARLDLGRGELFGLGDGDPLDRIVAFAEVEEVAAARVPEVGDLEVGVELEADHATAAGHRPQPHPMAAESQIESGHYSNASDYVRDLIRRDQEYHDKREILIKALIAGEKSGISKRTIDDIWKDVKARNS